MYVGMFAYLLNLRLPELQHLGWYVAGQLIPLAPNFVYKLDMYRDILAMVRCNVRDKYAKQEEITIILNKRKTDGVPIGLRCMVTFALVHSIESRPNIRYTAFSPQLALGRRQLLGFHQFFPCPMGVDPCYPFDSATESQSYPSLRDPMHNRPDFR